MTISKALEEVYSTGSDDVRHIETLQFKHSQFQRDYFFVNDTESWEFMLEAGDPGPGDVLKTFEAMPFELVLPASDNSGDQQLEILLPNIGREMMDEIEAANRQPSEPVQCIYRVYLDVPNSLPQNDPVTQLAINSIAADMLTLSATATRFDVLNKPFPTARYTIETFPGLER